MDISSWMVDTITVAPRTGADSYGMPTYGAQVTASARIEQGLRLVVNSRGADLLASSWVTTTFLINPDDKVWFNTDDPTQDQQARRPLAIKNAETKNTGYIIYEAYFK